MKKITIPTLLEDSPQRTATHMEEALVRNFYRRVRENPSSITVTIVLISALISALLWYSGNAFFAGMMTLVTFLYGHQLFVRSLDESSYDEEEILVCSYTGIIEVRKVLVAEREVTKFFLVDQLRSVREEVRLSKNGWGQISKVVDDYLIFADVAVGGGDGVIVLSIAYQS